jgi:hypothetical protein
MKRILLGLACTIPLACGGGGGGGGGDGGSSSGGGVPAGLPTTFALGLANGPGSESWMTGSGVPWNYRYQYLAGGVNTGGGWATWNSPAGQFATYYLDASAAMGVIPVFTYYMLTQSNPNPVDGDPGPNLQNASTMNAYFGDWKLLMQKCGTFGGTTIVHVEPDLWGYLQVQSGANPTAFSVAVASSGFAEVAGFANNARGFAQALVALRNAYAPNVRLAWHASAWATGVDLIMNSGDPNTLGSQTAAFYAALMAPFDLLFVDPSDRDAGFYQYVVGDGGAHWWDDADFNRFRDWIAALTSATGRKAMLWQIPMGNTLYRSCDNTWGHYQDNRAEYFLAAGNAARISAYVSAGAIGLLFGGGAGGCTSVQDTQGDGTTNPAPVNGNSLTATVSDDDGGFLRSAAAAYYASGPVAIP